MFERFFNEVYQTHTLIYVINFARPRSSPLTTCTRISLYTSGIQPDDDYLGLTETCRCSLQLLH